MTCIAGYNDGQTIMLMADCAVSTDRLLLPSVPHKLFRLGSALIGVSGAVRPNQLLRYRAPAPTLDVDGPVPSLLRWLDQVRTLMRDAGVLRSKEGMEEIESRMLIAFVGRFYEVDNGWQVHEPRTHYWAIGSGQGMALAAMHALSVVREAWPPGLPLGALLRVTLEAVATFDVGVRGPFEHIEMTLSNLPAGQILDPARAREHP